MRLISVIITVIVLSLLLGCDTGKKTSGETPSEDSPGIKETTTLSYNIKTFNRKSEKCPGGKCSTVKINYPEFENGHGANENINRIVQNQLTATLSDFVMEPPENGSMESLTAKFLDTYNQFRETFPESVTPWYVNIDAVVTYIGESFLSFSIVTSSYTGGAHPNESVRYINVDMSGKRIDDLSFFVSDKEKLTDLAERHFRAQNDLGPTDSFAEAGYTFENDRFHLTDNFGFSEAGMVFYYNDYEIAPHSMGPSGVTIPFEELKGIYRHPIP